MRFGQQRSLPSGSPVNDGHNRHCGRYSHTLGRVPLDVLVILLDVAPNVLLVVLICELIFCDGVVPLEVHDDKDADDPDRKESDTDFVSGALLVVSNIASAKVMARLT